MSITRDIAARFNARIQQRTASTRNGRFDLRLSDFEVLNNGREARLLVSYAKELGTPKRSQLDEWVTSSFSGQLVLQLESTRAYPQLGGVIAMAGLNEVRRPAEHADKMIRVSSMQYMDDEKSVWQVKKSQDGESYLIRVAKDDLDAILQEHQSKERTASVHHRLRMADVGVTSGQMELEIGDRVSYMYQGIMQRGQVTHVDQEKGTLHILTTAAGNADTKVVQREQVVDIFEKSPTAKKDQQSFLVDFFTKAYGDKGFAQKLVTLKNTGLK